MPTLVEVLPKNDDGRIIFSPAGKSGNDYIDGSVGVEWFKAVFSDIANATIPLAKDHYDELKAIDQFWKINTINWRKNGVVEVEDIPADEHIQEEEDFLLEMYPPAPQTEEQPTEEA